MLKKECLLRQWGSGEPSGRLREVQEPNLKASFRSRAYGPPPRSPGHSRHGPLRRNDGQPGQSQTDLDAIAAQLNEHLA